MESSYQNKRLPTKADPLELDKFLELPKLYLNDLFWKSLASAPGAIKRKIWTGLRSWNMKVETHRNSCGAICDQIMNLHHIKMASGLSRFGGEGPVNCPVWLGSCAGCQCTDDATFKEPDCWFLYIRISPLGQTGWGSPGPRLRSSQPDLQMAGSEPSSPCGIITLRMAAVGREIYKRGAGGQGLPKGDSTSVTNKSTF